MPQGRRPDLLASFLLAVNVTSHCGKFAVARLSTWSNFGHATHKTRNGSVVFLMSTSFANLAWCEADRSVASSSRQDAAEHARPGLGPKLPRSDFTTTGCCKAFKMKISHTPHQKTKQNKKNRQRAQSPSVSSDSADSVHISCYSHLLGQPV